jgi:hypothetical protein
MSHRNARTTVFARRLIVQDLHHQPGRDPWLARARHHHAGRSPAEWCTYACGRAPIAKVDPDLRLPATDLGQLAPLPTVLAALQHRRPATRLEVIPLDFSTAAELRHGQVDAAICTPRSRTRPAS